MLMLSKSELESMADMTPDRAADFLRAILMTNAFLYEMETIRHEKETDFLRGLLDEMERKAAQDAHTAEAHTAGMDRYADCCYRYAGYLRSRATQHIYERV